MILRQLELHQRLLFFVELFTYADDHHLVVLDRHVLFRVVREHRHVARGDQHVVADAHMQRARVLGEVELVGLLGRDHRKRERALELFKALLERLFDV